MFSNLLFWLINIVTLILLTSPLFLLLPYLLVLFVIFVIPLLIFFLYCYFSLQRSQSSIQAFENIVIAHRGGHPLVLSNELDDFPENTIAAYRWASKMKGADGIELDVWLSRDHIPMVSHDGYLEHTFANCREFISSLTCEQLKQFKYWKKNKRDIYDQIGCETIPTLEEVIIFLESTKLKLMIEIKETRKIPEISKIINDLYVRYPFLYERAYCAAFHPYNLYSIRRLNPRITTAFLFVPDITKYLIRNASQTPHPFPKFFIDNVLLRWIIDSIMMWFGTPAGLKFLGADLACVEQRQVSQNFLDEYKNQRFIVCAWCVNEREQYQWLRANGVSIITDTLFDVNEARLLNSRPLPRRPHLPKNYDELLIDRILNVYEKSREDFRVSFAGFFEGIDNNSYDLIYKDNILQFIAMTTYGVKYWSEMNKRQQRRVKHLYRRYLKIYPEQQMKIQSGYNTQIRLRHPFKDELQYTHHSMIKYILFACARSIFITVIKSFGFECQMVNDVPFYIRKSLKSTNLPPILFLHGLSLGTNSYILFIHRLSLLDRTIILLDIPHAIEELLNAFDVKKVNIISHSYGSIV
ncbi:unnamed protein product, partial [Adineta ricciae]